MIIKNNLNLDNLMNFLFVCLIYIMLFCPIYGFHLLFSDIKSSILIGTFFDKSISYPLFAKLATPFLFITFIFIIPKVNNFILNLSFIKIKNTKYLYYFLNTIIILILLLSPFI